jgi:predicted metalloprotease with PDZ domain
MAIPAIQYTVHAADLDGHRYEVTLRIANPNPAGQVLRMPAWIPGSYLIRDFSKHIETIAAFSVTAQQRKNCSLSASITTPGNYLSSCGFCSRSSYYGVCL